MTTIVIDKKRKIVASDSRWSLSRGDLIFYVDDTGFDKIADRFQASIVCCGDGKLIEAWRDWFLRPAINTALLPPTERMENDQCLSISINMVSKPDCRILFSRGWTLNYENEGMFSGSGAVHAKDCFSVNRCAKTAVHSASLKDPATGGETKYVEIETNRHNLSASKGTLAHAHEELLKRGMVMNTRTNNVTPISKLPPDISGTVSAISNGDVSLSAPTGLPHAPWSDAEKLELRKAMEQLAESEKCANAED